MKRNLAAFASASLLTGGVVALFVYGYLIPPRPAAFGFPMQIMPPWYQLPFYAILRAIPDRLTGEAAVVCAVFGFFLLPWILAAKPRERLARPAALICLALFLATIVGLGMSGAHEPDDPVLAKLAGPVVLDSDLSSYIWLGRFAALYYFAYAFAIAPLLGVRRSARTPIEVF